MIFSKKQKKMEGVMGIRFYCPNGHKLNVKTFLAGQRGICPKCGTRVDIPFESTREKGTKDLPIAAEWETRARMEGLYPFNKTAGGAAGNVNLNAIQTEVNTGFSPVAATGGTAQADTFAAQNPGPGAGAASAAHPFSAPAQPAANPFQMPSMPDPVDEAPDAVWYVRPTSGEQFGPVKGHIVKQWLVERRIQVDTLVWREGWSEWKTADQVFPSLGAGGGNPWNFH